MKEFLTNISKTLLIYHIKPHIHLNISRQSLRYIHQGNTIL